ncbi:MAG: hypothetical protein HLUCCA09_03180 [Rhodobacteraceae bacterium HLUCCA09]|nr:MAG: hypothetical protein HLUCCA09_03180 [Rhodobacteraceae bacterium HLUCCA09]
MSGGQEAPPPGWEGLLDPGERIIWRGQPSPRFRFSLLTVFFIVWAAIFGGVPLSLVLSGADDGGGAFLLLFVLVAAAVLGGHLAWPRLRSRAMFYTLTDRRAFIATDFFGIRSLKSYPITEATPLELRDGRGGGVIFERRQTRSRKGGTMVQEIGFLGLDDPREPFLLMRRIQADLRDGSDSNPDPDPDRDPDDGGGGARGAA